MDVGAYLKRINYTGGLAPSVFSLHLLQHAHVFTVPFENIDVFYQSAPVVLDLQIIFDKVVNRNRGGYCYELNGLFHWLLVRLGFNAQLVSARVFAKDHYTPDFDHMAIVVTIEGEQWLVDVGFGDFSRAPLSLSNLGIQNDGYNDYPIDVLQLEGKDYYNAQQWDPFTKKFISQCIFDLIPRQFNEFVERNSYQQTDPESYFRKTLMVSIPTTVGRISMVQNDLVTTENWVKRSERIKDEATRIRVWVEKFGIVV